ncbi:hypothetical protein NMY22_g4078 [Coprinellus aureogranulatus]|nr:hypothetical protein NMY22_g4078 [Coprinellus aureogranulatus]
MRSVTAIRFAICRAVLWPGCNCIVLFTDLIAMARWAVGPSVHSGQTPSLAVWKALTTWFSGHPEHSVLFVEAPSKLKWGIHYCAHLHATGMAPVRSGGHSATSLDSVCKDAADSALDCWTTMSRDPDYRGHQFLVLCDQKGKPLPPAYANGSAYLCHVNGDPKMCARFCRTILNHAPIGEYYARFNIPEDPECECGCPVQTHCHIFVQCGVLTTGNRDPKHIRELVGFLVTNPTGFSFNRPPAAVG